LKGFTELNRGAWCGLTAEEIGLDMLKRFDACDELVTPEGGESYSQLWNRVKQARDEVLAKLENGRSAAIVSHLQVTRCILHDALQVPLDQITKLKVATASITCIDFKDDESTVHFQSFKPDVGLAVAKDGAN
jgi:broad specificity phosphatase PhoE